MEPNDVPLAGRSYLFVPTLRKLTTYGEGTSADVRIMGTDAHLSWSTMVSWPVYRIDVCALCRAYVAAQLLAPAVYDIVCSDSLGSTSKAMRVVPLRPQLLRMVCWHTATQAFPGVATAKSDLISFDENQLLAVIDASRTWVSWRDDELSTRNDMLPSLNGNFCICRSRAMHPVLRGLTSNEHEPARDPVRLEVVVAGVSRYILGEATMGCSLEHVSASQMTEWVADETDLYWH